MTPPPSRRQSTPAGTGGSVYLAKGKFLTAELTLKGGMTFYVDKDATLVGGIEAADYPELLPAHTLATGNRRSLLFADGANGLIIDGPGVIDGQGKLVKMSGKEKQRPSLLRIFNSKDVTVRNITLANPAHVDRRLQRMQQSPHRSRDRVVA